MTDTALLPAALLNAATAHLGRFAPFNEMIPEDLNWMAQRLAIDYTAAGEVLLDPNQGVVQRFYVIKQGRVLGEQVDGPAQDSGVHWQLNEGECFPLGALLAERAVANRYRAAVDTFCYSLAASDFDALLARSPPFRDFCTRRLAYLLERSKQTIQAQYSHSASAQQPLSTPLASLIRRAPVCCAPELPLHAALATMHAENVGSILVVVEAQAVGIFTLHDLLVRVALGDRDFTAPMSSLMTRNPIALPSSATAHDAALAMARHGIRHVLINDAGRLVGLVSEKDLFTTQRVGLAQISLSLRNASQVSELVAAAHEIRELVHGMIAQGVGAEHLTQIVTALNDLLTQEAIRLAAVAHRIELDTLCWLALGSEGRMEQTLATDQDNGLIFSGGVAARAAFLEFAHTVNETLDACGFPKCRGGVMAGNPAWCLTLDEWQATFARWIDQGDPEALLHASIFFDFRPIAGQVQWAARLRAGLTERVRANPRFLHQMAANALRNRPPLGVVRDFVLDSGGEFDHTIDLKLNGTVPFVDAARIFSLASGDAHTNTLDRLRAAAAQLNIAGEEVDAWADAFLFVQMLKLRNQHLTEGQHGAHNHIDPDRLNELERRILKEAFRQARKLQARLALDHGL